MVCFMSHPYMSIYDQSFGDGKCIFILTHDIPLNHYTYSKHGVTQVWAILSEMCFTNIHFEILFSQDMENACGQATDTPDWAGIQVGETSFSHGSHYCM